MSVSGRREGNLISDRCVSDFSDLSNSWHISGIYRIIASIRSNYARIVVYMEAISPIINDMVCKCLHILHIEGYSVNKTVYWGYYGYVVMLWCVISVITHQIRLLFD